MKIITVIGARPQIIKAAGLSRAISENFKEEINEVIVHTGQHYDENMSAVFFQELGIPEPNYNLNVGSGKHGAQTAKMITGLEEILETEKPDAMVVYGDTNSTLAAAVAASKIHVPLVHIEAGLRSFNKKMPEEVNRIMCDHVSTLLFSPTIAGIDNLLAEGFSTETKEPFSMDNPGVFHCGDIMYDNSMHFSKLSDANSSVLKEHNLQGDYILSTIHRNDNTDIPERLNGIFEALLEIADLHSMPIVLPLHPRTKKLMEVNLQKDLLSKVKNSHLLKIINPVSFLDMIALEKNSKIIVTDSGGVQKEAFFFKKPCVILRPETEWIELVNCGAAKIVGWDKQTIVEAANNFMDNYDEISYPELFGDGAAGKFICEKLLTL